MAACRRVSGVARAGSVGGQPHPRSSHAARTASRRSSTGARADSCADGPSARRVRQSASARQNQGAARHQTARDSASTGAHYSTARRANACGRANSHAGCDGRAAAQAHDARYRADRRAGRDYHSAIARCSHAYSSKIAAFVKRRAHANRAN